MTANDYFLIGREITKTNPELAASILNSRKIPDPEQIKAIYAQIVDSDSSEKLEIFIAVIYKIYDPHTLNGDHIRRVKLNKLLTSILHKKHDEISKILSIACVKYKHVKSFRSQVDIIFENLSTEKSNVSNMTV